MDILKSVIAFIKEHHPEAGLLIKDDTVFTKIPKKERRLGYTRINYAADKWEISIGHPITPKTVYQVKAGWNNGQIVWVGRVIDGQVEEISYDSNLPE
jgi:hypothetical protein